jgi:tetratricopeptide (TPR) repeat protein
VLWRVSDFDAAEAACAAGLSALPSNEATRRERIQLWQLLARIDIERGRYDTAMDVLERSLTLAQELGDRAVLALVHYNLGAAHYYRGEADQARRGYQESLRIRAELGDVAGRIEAFNSLGLVHMANGESQEAMDCFTESSALCERLGMPGHQAAALVNLGQLQLERGHLDEAQAHLKRACAIYTGLNDRHRIAHCRYLLGDLALAQGQPAAALNEGMHALALAQQLRSVSLESCGLRVIGEALHAQGQLAEAETRLARARQLQTEVNDPYDTALILAAWAALGLDQGSPEQARSRAQQALALAQEQHMTQLSTRLEELLRRIGGDDERITAA